MRETVANALELSPALALLGITEKDIMLASAADNPAGRPFIVLRWGVVQPGMGTAKRSILDIYVHDEPGDYDRIDSCISAIRTTLDEIGQVMTPTGSLTHIEWNGDSGDLDDDTYGTIMRYSTFTLTGSGR